MEKSVMKKLPTLTFHPEILVDSARQLAKPPASESEEIALVHHRFLPKFPSKMHSTCKLIHFTTSGDKQHLKYFIKILFTCATTDRYWKDLKGATVSAVILLLVLQDGSIFNFRKGVLLDGQRLGNPKRNRYFEAPERPWRVCCFSMFFHVFPSNSCGWSHVPTPKI